MKAAPHDDEHSAGGDASPEPEQFDVCGALPGPGVTVLEASAGTGKTFTIAALVTRFVAQGVPIAEVLAVTFTRSATGELRDRVRARLVSAESGLARCLDSGVPPPADDALLGFLATGSREEVAERRGRLGSALTAFDEATITTTHGFCQLMLAGLGVDGDVAAGAGLLEDPRDLIEQVVDDLYVRWTLIHGTAPSFGRAQAVEIARAAVTNPDTPLVAEPEGSPAALRRRLAEGVRREVERRLLESNLLTFDDLLVRLKATLCDPHRGATASARLRGRYSVVLVDEFQDTDPVQWDVVRTAFGTGETVLVLIGDPKQAIYAFRGADVYSYLDAARLAGRRFTLGENWRSDADLLAALDALLDPVRLGHPEIPFRPVRAARSHEQPGLRGAPVDEPLRVRLVPAKESGLPTTSLGDVRKDAAVQFIAGDVAADVVRLLESRAELVSYDLDGAARGTRRLVPGDVAVLVRTNRQAGIVKDALRALDVPAVVSGSESVLTTPAAHDWLALLEATEQPSSRARAVAVALTPFLGMSADDVAAAGELEWEELHSRLHRWGETLRQRGVASLFRTVLAGEGVPGRVLRERDGERRLTDLGHIARLLHAEASQGHHGPPALRAWLARKIGEATTGGEGAEAEERSRWIDSDADAVQILTLHRSKGLEFPVVYCPFLWDEVSSRKDRPVVFHDPQDGMRRKLDVAGQDGDDDYGRHFALQRDEERGEALRELYVAVTRARHQVTLWWIRVKDANHSPIGRLLTVRDEDGNVATSSPRMPGDAEMRRHFERIASASGGLVSVETATGGVADGSWRGWADWEVGPLDVAAFERSLDLSWRRTSYSGITAGVHGGPAVGSEPEEPGTTDEPLAGTPAEVAGGQLAGGTGAKGGALEEESAMREVPSAWADLPSGTGMGTFVHRVLEEIDFAAPDLDGEIVRGIGASRSSSPLPLGPLDAVVAALRASITTPLGPLAGGISLRAIERTDRLDEMGFELPVVGGDRPGAVGAVSTSDIGRLFEIHEPDEPKGPLRGYGERLRDPMLGTDLRGYLTGSLDLVFRTPLASGADGAPTRYLVCDYKTNWLGAADQELTCWHYRPAALDAEMQRMHYPLQAVLYMVALHRYLRWRLRGYDPEVHLGGVLYLFLRGMSGPRTPAVGGVPCGVFSWRPPTALVTDMSELFEVGS
ncbi:MAG: UvrD-helicase domain-containing protein [Actinomycetota bacterium]|nr:UvrD-helicase domain-containing protein [Actinomycetota bacterium]